MARSKNVFSCLPEGERKKGMAEIIKLETGAIADKQDGNDLLEVTENMLTDIRSIASDKQVRSVPIASLAALGGSAASLSPALRTVTETMTVNAQGLYTLANESVGDTLKLAKDGNFWGALKTAEGKSKMAKLQSAGPLSASSTTTIPVNPATMMMAVALYSIEKKLGDIEEMQKQILSFLEIEKESEIEADVQMLTNLIRNYKSNWDNEHFVASNHKLVIDIKRTALKHMNSYQKKMKAVLAKKILLVDQNKMKSISAELKKKIEYYRLSLYTYSLASLLEIMLSGNFKEEYITGIKAEIEKYTAEYRLIFDESSRYLEKLGSGAIDANLLGGIGMAGKKMGDLIGAIPVVKNGPVDEFLQDNGRKLEKKASHQKAKAVHDFAALGNPQTGVLTEKMQDMIDIYNHTEQICFDRENI
jgi:hypothetical protein